MLPTDMDIDKIKKQWSLEQYNLKKSLSLQNSFQLDKIKYVAGVDLSFYKGNNIDACAGIIVMSYPSFEIVYQNMELVQLTAPYIPSFLAFREVKHLNKLINQVIQEHPEYKPDIIMVDGNGILHQYGFGLASHLGVICDIPTIGIGKSYYAIDGITLDDTRRLEQTLKKGGESINLLDKGGEILGAILKPTDDVQRGIYVSIGHKIDLGTALYIVKQYSRYRVPEPRSFAQGLRSPSLLDRLIS